MQINRNIVIPPIGGREATNQTVAQAAPDAGSFRQIMENVTLRNAAGNTELQFSKHANMRLNARNIQLDSAQMQRIEDGVARAQGKGIRDGLVLVDNIALVVNITNRVVVTALSQQDQVFTNIDGAVIV